ncbi:MAG: HNH endonuclease [Deltaproteobacteria bacterium]|nr:MAG: HNH endonuclease [Deltaproteobacteria bacterium]
MANARTRRLLLAIAQTDATFERLEWRGRSVWQGKCIHCDRKHQLAADGTPLSRATVEHIVPQHRGGTDDLHNLAIACARCNHLKGARQDRRRADDPSYVAMVERLQVRRRGRWREPE